MNCVVYKSLRHSETYLYVREEDGLDRVPEELLKQLGPTEPALTFVLTEDRRLAKEDPKKVIESLASQGFHLQLPPHKRGMLGATGPS